MDVAPNYFPEHLAELVKQGRELERDIDVLERDLALIDNAESGLPIYMRFMGHIEDVRLSFLHEYHRCKIKMTVVECIKAELDSRRMELESLKEELRNEYFNI